MNKNNWLMVCAAAACLLVGQVTEGIAQKRLNAHFVPYSSVTFGGGSSTYFGDLAGYRQPFKSLTTLPRWNVGLGYSRQFTPHFAARAMFTWARISGDDFTFSKSNPTQLAIPYARNLHFRNDLKEFALTGIYNFIADGRTPENRAKITPYLFGGVALLAHSPEARTPTETNGNNGAYEARKWVKLQPLHTEGQGQPGYEKPYSLVTVAIPVGIGARYMINEFFNVGLEVGYRYTFTDYLDDVGGDYAQPDALQGLSTLMADRRFERDAARENKERYTVATQLFTSDPTPFSTTTRGEKGILPDGYLLTQLTIQYVIPGKIKCPPIR
ncbi:hypothetical protein IC229_11520 [Spirosoma sp. BT702]|uniref:DUF6089 domain-containing protein n=1 Tax=Spirosoma profusum TaxID=2771354 RepID=A0A926XVA6_9BACT|nr:DUF6089 family protein [Spirosoma profusum]MBD2701269.1 hypothetical protein [Spirosoma profusum]